jgi:hypothetical protein
MSFHMAVCVCVRSQTAAQKLHNVRKAVERLRDVPVTFLLQRNLTLYKMTNAADTIACA